MRRRLLTNNGGEIAVSGQTYELHPVFDDSNRRTIARTTSHIVHETEEARTWRGFPTGAISIADCDGDKLILLERSDQVHLWSHEGDGSKPIEATEMAAALALEPSAD
jgi:hypothetical protein